MDLALPRGIRDIEPDEFRLHEQVRRSFVEVAKLYNFGLMEPAPIEHLSTLRAKSGDAIDEQIYAFRDKSERDVGLRFDLTVGMTRYVSARRDLKPPVKLGCYGGVWRYDEPQYARYRWFHQWDLEIFGEKGIEADAEVIDASYTLSRKLGVDAVVRIGDRRVVEEYLRKELKVSSEEKLAEMMRALDKVQKKTSEQLETEYGAKGVRREDLRQLLDFGRMRGPPAKILEELSGLHLESCDGLAQLWGSLESRRVDQVEYDLSVVRGIDYYTGIVFEVADRVNPRLGSLCGGGRYDLLPRIMGRPDLAATGVAGGVERAALSISKTHEKTNGPTLFVAYTDHRILKKALQILREIRETGIDADISLHHKPLSKQLQAASEAGARWALILGPRELDSGTLTLRDMPSHAEERLSLDETIRKILASR